MARSKAISYGRLIVKNLHTLNISTPSQNSKILKDTARCRMILSTTTAFHARRTFCDLSGKQELPRSPLPSSPLSSIWYVLVWMIIVKDIRYY
ncbi:hypothetical protein Hanom_Chr02g00137311 [Helianthus anomalus]